MRTIIAGTRTAPVDAVEEAWKFFNAREGCPRTTWIISGGAQGADEYGEMIARAESIAMRLFRADWKMHGRAAGPIRNEQMAKNADACLVVWDGKSRGSYSMIRLACMHGLDVVVWYYGEAAGRPPWMSKEQPEGSLPWTKENMKTAKEIREMMPRPHVGFAAKLMPLIEKAALDGFNTLNENMCGDLSFHMLRADDYTEGGQDEINIYELGTFFEKHGFNVKWVTSLSMYPRKAVFLEISWDNQGQLT